MIINKGRFRLFCDKGFIKIELDGHGLSMQLSPEEQLRLSRALWYDLPKRLAGSSVPHDAAQTGTNGDNS